MRKWGSALALTLCVVMIACAAGAEGAGSWGQINQPLARPEGWQKIVAESGFPFGEKTKIAGTEFFSQSFGAYPSIDGSTVAVPMAMEFARQHLTVAEADLPGFVFFSTTHHAYENLIMKRPNGAPLLQSENAAMDDKRPVDLIIVTGPSDEELQLAKDNGVTLVQQPVCFDAFVFITHRDNPIDSLTVDQIRAIYAGEIKNWKDVGGPDKEIFAYQREPNSGSQTGMEKLVMQGTPLSGAQPMWITDGMGDLVRRVGDYDNKESSLGYTYKYYIDTLYRSEEIKTIAINGVEPTNENLRAGKYPFTTQYFGIIRAGDETQPGGLFLDWILTEEGQRCVRQAGYVPVLEVN